MKQYNQHPDKHGCTYYAVATCIANTVDVELTKDDMKAIAVLMERKRVWRRTGYTIKDAFDIITEYIKYAYKKVITYSEVNTRTYNGDSLIVVIGKIDAGYVLDIKDGVLNGDLPTKGVGHARCIYKKDGIWYIVENFFGMLPYNIIKIGPQLPKGISTLGYICNK